MMDKSFLCVKIYETTREERLATAINKKKDFLMVVSLLLIIIGLVYLLKNLGFISGGVWGIIWPLILVALGLYLILKRRRSRMFWERVWRKLE